MSPQGPWSRSHVENNKLMITFSPSLILAKMALDCLLVPAINYYHKALHLGCCSSPRSASGSESISDMLRINLIRNKFILRVYVICYAYMLYITRICYMLRVYVICYAYMSYVSRICYCLKIMESIEMMDSFQMK